MTRIAEAIQSIRQASERVTVAEFAREAGLPYSTVHSFWARKWAHKNLEALDRLEEAARRINRRARPASASPPQNAA